MNYNYGTDLYQKFAKRLNTPDKIKLNKTLYIY